MTHFQAKLDVKPNTIGWEVFNLSYTIEFPLDTIITEEVSENLFTIDL